MHTFSGQTLMPSPGSLHIMLVNSVHFTFAPEDGEVAKVMLSELRDASLKEEGVMTFDVVQGSETATFALWEEYANQAAFDAHTGTEHFQRLVVNGVRRMAKARDAVKGSSL
jgi:quinol monooxygenase YgiN